MANEWPRQPLSELTEPGSPITYGVVKPGDEGPVRFVRGGDIAGGRVLTDQLRTISDDVSAQYRRTLLRGGELLVSLVGNPGQVALAPRSLAGANIARQVGLIRLGIGVVSEFVKYFLLSPEGQRSLGAHSIGSVQQVINLQDLKTVRIPVPPLPIQHRIANVLGKLDDKIELNRRMNLTLENMAAAVFKSWFIDFDPVRAKTEGHDPGVPAEIADLFPDSFEDSALGPIPKGWKPGSLGDVADSPRRGVKPADVPPTTPYIGLEHMPRRNIALDAWGRAEDVASGKSQFRQGEILFGKLRPYFHKVGIAPVDGVCSTDIVVVKPKASHWHGYAISLVSSKAFVDYTDSHSAGTKMPRTNWKDMSRYPLALPPEPLTKAFQDHAAALHKRIGVSVRQNRCLAGLRDTLLPKLLSGEIDMANVKAGAEEVPS